MIFEKGRPMQTDGRLNKEIKCYDFLDKLGVEYMRADHEPGETMEICRVIEKTIDCKICKNLFLCNRQKTAFYMLLIPGDKIFKTKDLSAQIGSSRLSFADGEAMERILDITPGSLSILGLMNDLDHDVTLLIDEEVLSEEFVGVHPCINTSTVKLSMKDLKEKIIPALKHRPTTVSLPRYEAEEV